MKKSLRILASTTYTRLVCTTKPFKPITSLPRLHLALVRQPEEVIGIAAK